MIKITDKTLTADKLTEIGTTIETVANKSNYYAFFSLDLSSATEVTEIPEEAFSTCRLRGLILPDSLETIGIGAFGYNRFEEIVIPDNVKTIKDGGFEYCSNLKTITLPASLVSIGASAFASTVLETVYYKGTQEQWAQINIDDYNDKLTGLNNVTRQQSSVLTANYHCKTSNPAIAVHRPFFVIFGLDPKISCVRFPCQARE